MTRKIVAGASALAVVTMLGIGLAVGSFAPARRAAADPLGP